MDRYLEALATSALPFDVGIAASIWGVLFVANHLVVARARATNDTQSMIALQGSASLRRGSQPMFVLLQVVVAAFVFAAGAAIGGVAATFFIGGQLVAVASNLGLNVQSLAAARTLASQQGVDGSLVLSEAYLWRQSSQRMAAAGVTSLLLGFALAHAALLGGAFILGSTAAGFLRRARQVAR
jgi:hypothetical protein